MTTTFSYADPGADITLAQADALVNTVNCVGVMGKGLALAFKRSFGEEMMADYRLACAQRRLVPGTVHVWNVTPAQGGRDGLPRFVVQFPTKAHWRDPSRYEWIQAGLADLAAKITRSGPSGVSSIHVPPLGCGLGGLDWDRVEPMIRTHLADVGHDLHVVLHAPHLSVP